MDQNLVDVDADLSKFKYDLEYVSDKDVLDSAYFSDINFTACSSIHSEKSSLKNDTYTYRGIESDDDVII